MTQNRRVGWREWDERDVDWTAAPTVAGDDNPFRDLDEAEEIPQIPVPVRSPSESPPSTPPRAGTNLVPILIAVGLGIVALSMIVGVAIGVFSQFLAPAGEPVVIPEVVHAPGDNSPPLPPALPDGGEPTP